MSKFKQHCLAIIRRVERTGTPVAVTRRGKVQGRRAPSGAARTLLLIAASNPRALREVA